MDRYGHRDLGAQPYDFVASDFSDRGGIASGLLVVTVGWINGLSLVGVGGLGHRVTGCRNYGPGFS